MFKGIPNPKIIEWKKTNELDSGGPVNEVDSLSFGYYILKSSGLGWINCDKFSENENKIPLSFVCDRSFNGNATLIFTEIKSILAGSVLKGEKFNTINYENVPEGREAIVLLFAISADKQKVFYATQKIKIGEKPKKEMVFKETSAKEFEIIAKTLY